MKKIKWSFLVLVFSIVLSQVFAGQTMTPVKASTSDDDLGFDDDFEEDFEEGSDDDYEEDSDDTDDVDDDSEDDDSEDDDSEDGDSEDDDSEDGDSEDGDSENDNSEGGDSEEEEAETPEPTTTPEPTSAPKPTTTPEDTEETEEQKDSWLSSAVLNVIDTNFRENSEGNKGHIKAQLKQTKVGYGSVNKNESEQEKTEVAKSTIMNDQKGKTNSKQNETERDNVVLAKVGDKYIYYNDVDLIYQQFWAMREETEEFIYTRQKIFEDILDEFTIIANAEKYGVFIQENEYEELIEEYKDTEPDSYAEGVKIYGEEAFISSIKEQMIYELVCEAILEEERGKNKSNILEQFKVKHIKDAEELLLEDTELIKLYEEEINAFAIENWLKENRDNVTVDIYEENIKYLAG